MIAIKILSGQNQLGAYLKIMKRETIKKKANKNYIK